MGIGETITVINRSGKVVSSSKHIVNVFKEAKSAYRERKAEIQAERKAAALQEKKLRDGVKSLRLEDDVRSRASHRSRATHRSKSHRHPRPPIERGITDSFYANEEPPRRKSHRYEQDLAGDAREGHIRELARRNTDTPAPVSRSLLKTTRSHSEPYIDMDLAYGELPPPLPAKCYDDGELKEKASTLTRLLDEANCLQHSATTIIDNLQNNPEALAAVALTLAEISNIVGKMGPGVLTTLKGSFPVVAALLVSPQFMIAAGVGIGVTIVALGGFKIIKKIQAQKEEKMMEEPHRAEPYQLDELESRELTRIEIWRRGIADVEAESSGTTVDGEFITPAASRHLVAAGVLDEEELRSRRHSRIGQDKEHRAKSHRAKSTKTAKTSASRSKSVKESSKSKKKKEPSVLRSIFRSRSH